MSRKLGIPKKPLHTGNRIDFSVSDRVTPQVKGAPEPPLFLSEQSRCEVMIIGDLILIVIAVLPWIS